MSYRYNHVYMRRVSNGRLSRRRAPAYSHIYICSVKEGFLTETELSRLRFFIQKSLKNRGHVWFRSMTPTPFSKKPLETRMGKGKGVVVHNSYYVPKGFILFELSISNSEKITLLISALNKMSSLKLKSYEV